MRKATDSTPWLTRGVIIGMVVVLLGSPCWAADGEGWIDDIGKKGTYNASEASPDTMTAKTHYHVELRADDGWARPVRPEDQKRVVKVRPLGPSIIFRGRSTGWGCAYTTTGFFVGGEGKKPDRWTEEFKEDDSLRIALEINQDGSDDDVVFLRRNGGTLHIWVFGTTKTVSVKLSAIFPEMLSDLPETVDVSPGMNSTPVVLNGQTAGVVDIHAEAGSANASISAKVLGFTPKLVPDDDFEGRNYHRVGVGETGKLQVDLPPGINLTDLAPLTWSITSGDNCFAIDSVRPNAGTAVFRALEQSGDVTLTLTDRYRNPVIYAVAVVHPTGQSGVKIIDKTPDNTIPTIPNFTVGQQGAAMLITVSVLPSDVSFRNAKVREIGAPPWNVQGYFLRIPNYHVRLRHDPSGWLDLGPGNEWHDRAGFWDFAGPWQVDGQFEGGQYSWNIPVWWHLNGNNDHQGDIPQEIQTMILAPDGGSYITKRFPPGGTVRSRERWPNGTMADAPQ